VAEQDKYVLGYRQAEQERLQRQAEQLAADSIRLFDEIGSLTGARVLEIGCGPLGCLELLSERVGPSGTVVGIELSDDAVQLAKKNLSERKIKNVEVLGGNARSAGLPYESFDLVTSRLVLVNVPAPEQIISEAIALARPGGVVAFHEVDWEAMICEPLVKEWSRLIALFLTVADKNGSDFYIGRRLPRLLREAGINDLQVYPIVHFHPIGDPRRMLLLDFAGNFKDRILELRLIEESEFEALQKALEAHLSDPTTAVFIGPYVQAWGRKSL
jgi:SAM-dependent methyltransferase